jgi:hypothetical protein
VYTGANSNSKEDLMPGIQRLKDADAALVEAKATRKPVLLDLSAAPL